MEKSVEEMPDDLLQSALEEEEAIPVDEFEMSNEELSEYSFDDEGDVADYKTKDDYYPELDNDKVIPIKAEQSLHELLMDQLSMLALADKDYKIAEQIVGSLDDDGYLRRALQSIADDLAFKQSMWVEEKEIEQILKQVQAFDPVGIAARDLKECLLIQLRRKGEGESAHLSDSRGKLYSDDEARKIAILILEKYFEEFTRKHYDKIQKSLHLDESGMKEVLHQILTLNPKPGAAYYIVSKVQHHITPDFFIDNSEQRMELRLNSKNAPPLRISEGFTELLQAYNHNEKADKKQREAVQFIKQKLDAAKWFIDAIRQRQQTLIKCMQAIIVFQNDFFKTGDESKLKPMILKDIAEITQLDMSTISRVANSKYVQTEFGTFQLKYFFSEAITNSEGEEVTNKEVRNVLAEIIENEDKSNPYNDDVLTELIAQKGFKIARRTVGKYREHMNIPPARLRKQL
jgi:RNA polymerase sigma-54 factor